MSSIVAGLGRKWQDATLLDGAWLLLCGLVFWGSKWAGHLFEGIPGHASMFWVPALFLALARVNRSGAVSLTAFLGGFLWSLPRANPLGIAPYLAAGAVLDLFAGRQDRLPRLPWALAAGLACSLAKFSFHNMPAAMLGSPHFLELGLGMVGLLHAIFGLAGGFLGWLILRSPLRRA